MKHNKLYTYLLLGTLALMTSCMNEQKWTEDYDINFPEPTISTISATRVAPDDTLDITGQFEKLTTATIGGGFAKIHAVSADNTFARIVITETCTSGQLVLQNTYKKKGTFEANIFVEGGGQKPIVEEVVILDFSKVGSLPTWTKNTWVEVKNFESQGYDLNNIAPPAGYEHFYTMNDTLLYPPNEPIGQGGNIPYGNYTNNNEGMGFDISFYTDPYVSVLINTGNDIAYLSLVINGNVRDFDPSHSPGGRFANGERKHYMKTDNKWIWYTFSLSKIMGGEAPTTISSAGLFIRNSWDYGAEDYPGFQLNIVKMVVTEGPLPRKTVIFDFEEGEPTTTTEVTGWASDLLTSYGLNLSGLGFVPSGNNYYSMINHHSDNYKSYKFAVKSDNNGAGFDFSKMKDPHLTFAVNTGARSGFVDFVFYQEASGNKHGEPWTDPGCNGSALNVYSEATAQPGVSGSYYSTNSLWEWRTYNLTKMLNGVESWGLQGGKYPDFSSVFDYILIWPRDGWNNDLAAPRYEVNIDYVIVTDGIPTGLPQLND